MIYKFSYFVSSAFTSFLSRGFSVSFEQIKKQYRRTMFFKRLDTVGPEFREAISFLRDNCYVFYSFEDDCYELIIFSSHAMWRFVKYEGITSKYQHIQLKDTSFDEKMLLLENKKYKKFMVLKHGIGQYLANTHFKDNDNSEKTNFEDFIKEKLFNSPIKMEL